MYTIDDDISYEKQLSRKKQKVEVNRIILAINKNITKKIKNLLHSGYTKGKIFRSRNKLQSQLVGRYHEYIIHNINVPGVLSVTFSMRSNVRLFGFGRRNDLYVEI